MPDGGAAQELIYRRAVRGQFATILMIAGPSGTGKTYSALRLARGMAGGGRIFVADTDNGRAKLYADEFEFDHLDLREPFRPKLFEDAAIAAQRQGAAVLIIDNFAHEHAGPGGLLEFHETELERLTKGDLEKRDSLNMVAWIKPKLEHKHMRERLYQLNIPVILCCNAERKVAMQKQTEGKNKGKIVPVDLGYQPITALDIPYAATASFMLLDVAKPGVPTPIKALLPALRPIIELDKPLDETTGSRIGVWMRGEVPPQTSPAPAAPPPPAEKPRRQEVDESALDEGIRDLQEKFLGTSTRADHLALVDDASNRKRIEWLKRHRRERYASDVEPYLKASWARTDPKAPPGEQSGMNL